MAEGWWERCQRELHEGRCRNPKESNYSFDVCVQKEDGTRELRRLAPGDSTKPEEDCEGIIHSNEHVTKLWGATGFESTYLGTREIEEKFGKGEWARVCIEMLKNRNEALFGYAGQGGRCHLSYSVLCESLGESPFVPGGWYAGTRGRRLRMDGFVLRPEDDIGFRYYGHIQSIGDTSWQYEKSFLGVPGQRLEGFAIGLTRGADRFDVYYMAHLQGTGDTQWYSNEEFCGTKGDKRPVEGITVFVAPKQHPRVKPKQPKERPSITDSRGWASIPSADAIYLDRIEIPGET